MDLLKIGAVFWVGNCKIGAVFLVGNCKTGAVFLVGNCKIGAVFLVGNCVGAKFIAPALQRTHLARTPLVPIVFARHECHHNPETGWRLRREIGSINRGCRERDPYTFVAGNDAPDPYTFVRDL